MSDFPLRISLFGEMTGSILAELLKNTPLILFVIVLLLINAKTIGAATLFKIMEDLSGIFMPTGMNIISIIRTAFPVICMNS